MNQLHEVCERFEVLNEPNHFEWSCWGSDTEAAKSFNTWFLHVYSGLKEKCPWAQLGFPGLAVAGWVSSPHNELEWLELCREAMERADWLGVHCYWQNYDGASRHLSEDWGLAFKKYHAVFPNKIIDITECGNSNGQNNKDLPPDVMTREILEYYQELFKCPYLNSVNPFIMSSDDDTWNRQLFVWVRKSNGTFLPVVEAVRKMGRPTLVPPKAEEEEEPLAPPVFALEPVPERAPLRSRADVVALLELVANALLRGEMDVDTAELLKAICVTALDAL
jgi:hypothetical protein